MQCCSRFLHRVMCGHIYNLVSVWPASMGFESLSSTCLTFMTAWVSRKQCKYYHRFLVRTVSFFMGLDCKRVDWLKYTALESPLLPLHFLIKGVTSSQMLLEAMGGVHTCELRDIKLSWRVILSSAYLESRN